MYRRTIKMPSIYIDLAFCHLWKRQLEGWFSTHSHPSFCTETRKAKRVIRDSRVTGPVQLALFGNMLRLIPCLPNEKQISLVLTLCS